MKDFNSFTGLYPVTRTMRFSLKPVDGININRLQELIQVDQHRADIYPDVKKIIDDYHKAVIFQALNKSVLKIKSTEQNDSLVDFFDWYFNKSAEKSDLRKKAISIIQGNLRQQIAKALTGTVAYKRLFGKELIKEDLQNFVANNTDSYPDWEVSLSKIKEFEDFTTYFTGFQENRKNMYTAKEQSTAISYRLINENLPRFADNCQVYAQLSSIEELSSQVAQVYTDFEAYLNVFSLDEVFVPEYYNELLTHRHIEVYNAIIGGRSEGKVKIKGLNEYINLYNQNHKESRLPLFKPLYKQILSDRETLSWLPEVYLSDSEVLESIAKYCKGLIDYLLNKDCAKPFSIVELFQGLANGEFNLNNIYIKNDSKLSDLSQKAFGEWSRIQDALLKKYCEQHPKKKTQSEEKYKEKDLQELNKHDCFSISYINSCLDDNSSLLQSYFSKFGAVQTETGQKENCMSRLINRYTEACNLLNNPYPSDKSLLLDDDSTALIKNLLDSIKDVQYFIQPLVSGAVEPEKDERFYSLLSLYWDQLDMVTSLYNQVRNYLTRKPYTTEKIKLNFENKGQFLGGWVDSKTEKSDNGTQAGGYLFRKKNQIGEYDYFLGISADPKLFRNKGVENFGGFERLDYYQPKSTSIYGSSYAGINGYEYDKQRLIEVIEKIVGKIDNKIDKDNIIIEFEKIKVEQKTPSLLINILKTKFPVYYDCLLDNESFQSVNKVVIENLHQTILNLTRIPSVGQYKDCNFRLFTEVQSVIEDLCKSRVFGYFSVSDADMEAAINKSNKPLFLFKISNKDLSFAETYSRGLRKNRGTENLHTLYFKELMEQGQRVMDIGTGAVFFRKATVGLKKEPTHPKGLPVRNKNIETIKRKPESIFDYDLVKNKRYTIDSFQFHLSFTLNFKCDKSFSINEKVNELIKNGGVEHVIGIDRGERNLLYLVVIDRYGNIIEQQSLNKIVNEYNVTDYHQLLSQREDERGAARKSWRRIENIKDLKEGYLSQVIHKIAQWVVQYNAIIVLEDLNMGFKRSRQKFETQVYQKFEKMLIDKLNYLADKHASKTLPGGILNGYQLTDKFNSFKEIGKQNGFLFYVPAWNTSKIDPVTGFVNLFDLKYENKDKARLFFSKFDKILYNSEKDWFEFEFDYSRFDNKRAIGVQTYWRVCTYGSRIITFRNPSKNNEWDTEELDLTDAFKKLFVEYGINIDDNLKDAICMQDDKDFFVNEKRQANSLGLFQLFKLMLQMRNSLIRSEVDYLISPAVNQNGECFDSRKASKSLPENADANGAYNIARKGLWVIHQIQSTDTLKNVKFSISNKEWLDFAQQKPYLPVKEK